MSPDVPAPPPAYVAIETTAKKQGDEVKTRPILLQGWSLDGAVFAKGQYARGNLSLLPAIDIPDQITSELAGIVNIRRDTVVIRSRLTLQAPIKPEGAPTSLNATLLEAAWDGYLTDRIDVRLGKTFLGWDPGFVTQPNGFFQGQADFADITDFENRLEGVWLGAITYAGDIFDVSFAAGEIANDTRLTNPANTQYAIRAASDIGSTTVSGILRTTNKGQVGLGGTATTSIGQSVTAQASAFGDKHGLRAALGGSWLHKSGISVSSELSYDELNPARTPFIATTTPRLFADIRVSQTGRSADWSLAMRKPLEDDSFLITAAVGHKVSNWAILRLEAGIYLGSDNTHFGRAPIKNFIGFSVVTNFEGLK